MTRKDFELIARVLRETRVSGDESPAKDAILNDAAYHFAAELRYTNERFDADRFLTACGVPS